MALLVGLGNIASSLGGFFSSIIPEFSSLHASFVLNQTILIGIALVVIIAAILAFISKLLKQELILAYIIAGIILGPLVLGLIREKAIITGFAEIGITFLLFVAGLEMSIKKFKESLGTTMLTGIIQVISVAVVSFFVFIAFQFGRVEALWLGIAIAFSSTVTVTKILADKGELKTLHARLIIGVMLAQDIIAIIALAVLSKQFTLVFVIVALLKLALMGFIAVFLSLTLVRPVINKAASSQELLFLVSIAFLFLFALLSHFLNLSIAIGAFVAGIMLANTKYHTEIGVMIKSLRDFFAVMFFVAIGMWLTNLNISILLPLIPLIAILIIFEPLVTALILRVRGYKTKTALDTGFSFAQVSEFTLIIVLYALTLGVVTQRAFDLIVLTAVITIAITPYTLKLGNLFYKTRILNFIKIPVKEKTEYLTSKKKTLLLVGCHRMGSVFIKQLEKIKHKILVLDFNPEIIKVLEKKNISCVHGDIKNNEMLQYLPLSKLRVVISTVPSREDNLLVIRYFKNLLPKVFVAVTAQTVDEGIEMYKQGADYVIVPLIMGAEQAIASIKKLTKKQFRKLKKGQIDYLKDIQRILRREEK